MKSDQELRAAEKRISKSSAPSKTKPVTERLSQSIGKERKLLPGQTACESEDSGEVKTDSRKYVHTLRSSMSNETNSKMTNTALGPTVGKV